MTQYRIVCTQQEPLGKPHDQAHIVNVGVTNGSGGGADEKLTVSRVWSKIDRGDRFYTESDDGTQADVHKYECDTCGKKTLRSDADDNSDNNLDNLQRCQ